MNFDKGFLLGLGFNFAFDRFQMMMVQEIGLCWHCYTKTHFIEIGFGMFLCSEECVRTKWRQYIGSINS